jgi:hypothetical protein
MVPAQPGPGAAADKQRVEKLLEDAQIKLSSVASNIFGVWDRQMLAVMLAGQRDPKILAGMAHGRMRRKIRCCKRRSPATTRSCAR